MIRNGTASALLACFILLSPTAGWAQNTANPVGNPPSTSAIVRSWPAAISPENAARSVTGVFVGGSDCPTGIGIELHLQPLAMQPGSAVIGLKGDMRTYSLPGQGHFEDIKTPVTGTIALSNGLLKLQDDPPPVDPCLAHVLGKCIVAHSSSTMLDQHFAESAERKRAEAAARSHFRLNAVRADSGEGWFGTVQGGSYKCAATKLRRSDSASTADLPLARYDLPIAIISDINSTVDPILDPGSTAQARIVWLNFAAERGNTQAMETLGSMYENGEGVAKDWSTALRYYTGAAEKGDALVQARLAKLYASGEQVPKNQQESERLTSLSNETKQQAAHICFSNQAVVVYYGLLNAERNDPVTKTWEIFGSLLVGIHIDDGNFLISQIAATNVRRLDRAFVCLVEGHVLGQRVTNTMPRQEVMGYDADGDVVIQDNSAEVAIRNSFIGLANELAKQPVIRGFTVERVSERRYRISLNGQSPYLTEADIDP
jgi:TPR repeat protein